MVSTRHTDDTANWLKLLKTLTDDELEKYSQIAADQRDVEYDRWWAQVACMLGTIAALVLAVRMLAMGGQTRSAILFAVVAIAVGIWPYRKARMRRLWQRHLIAVDRERARRASASD
ncbi:MAG: hypothetical protein ACR2PG_08340 [Hyphomicrobiaceae bacterium]